MPNRVELIHVDVPMTEPFRISSGTVESKQSIVIRIVQDGVAGFGEASPMTGGFYSNETPESTFRYLAEIAVPAMLDEGSFSPEFVERRVSKTGSNPFAWAGIDGALWDLRAARSGRSISQLLGLEPRPVECGLAVGIYPTVAELIQACESYLRDGYKRVKIKIEPGWDLEPLRALRETFGGIPLMVDANASYSEKDFPVFDEIDRLGLTMVEQPLAKGNLEGHARLQARITTPVCFDESASDEETVLKAIRMGACRVVNVKVQRVGGLAPAIRICDLCAVHGIPCWVGTMPELGIGALHALYLAAHPNCVYPTDVEASSRWFVEDLIDPPISVRDGIIEIDPAHRIRPRVNLDAIDRYAIKSRTVSR